MAIMNYTTTVKPEKTATIIQQMLREAGARSVLLEYMSDGRLDFIAFRLDTAMGAMFFKLPAHIDGTLNAMRSDLKIPRRLAKPDQAERVAWRIVKDWTECQLALVESGQATLEQAFLQYAQAPDGRTLYEHVAERGLMSITHEVADS